MEHLLNQDRIVHILSAYGYWTLFLVVALECAGLPLPGETFSIGGAIYAGETGGLRIEFLILAAAAGAFVGGAAGYGVGRAYGVPFLERYGRWFGLTAKRLMLARYLFKRWGAGILLLGRFVNAPAHLGRRAGRRQSVRRPHIPALQRDRLQPLGARDRLGAPTRSTRRFSGSKAPIAIWALTALLYALFCAFIYVRRHEARLLREAEAAFAAKSAEPAS